MNDVFPLTVHRFLLRAGLALGNIFAWIVIFDALYYSGETWTGALFLTITAYALGQILVFLLTPLSAANLPHGSARSMLISVFALGAAFLWLGSSATATFGSAVGNLLCGIVGFVFLSSLYRALYWVPYKVAATHTQSAWSHRTRFLLELFLALLPLAAALIIATPHGVWLLFVGTSILAFLASVPLLRIRDSYERFDWSYSETLRALFSRSNRPLVSQAILDGVQGAGLLLLWPLAVFMLLDWSYLHLGIIISVTLLIALLLRRSVRSAFQALGPQRMHYVSTVLGASSWVLRLVVFSPVTVVIADTIYHLGVPARRYGMDPIAYEQAADASHYIDEYTVLKEMGNAVGRIFLCMTLVFFMFFMSPVVALAGSLILAAVASIGSVILFSAGNRIR